MTPKQPPSRIPAETLGEYQTWRLPVIDNNGRVLSSAEKEARDQQEAQRKREQESIENIDLAGTPHVGMTAQEMQEIFDAAEQDGFAQGHKEGLEKGRAEGYEAGQQQGLMEMRQHLEQEQQRFQSLAQALLAPLQDQDRDIEQMLVEAICTLTRSVVQRELLVDSSQILDLVQAAVSALPVGSKNIRIRLSPEDLPVVEEYAAQQQLEWRFISDSQLTAGGCLVETSESRVDFSVARRLEVVLEQFVNKQLSSPDQQSDAASHAECES
jgi:flagellar assembly protein FliH